MIMRPVRDTCNHDTESGRPGALDNPAAGWQCAVRDFRAQQVGKVLFEKPFGRMSG